MNALAEVFGVQYQDTQTWDETAIPERGAHSLVEH
jgi:hypothetical protein